MRLIEVDRECIIRLNEMDLSTWPGALFAAGLRRNGLGAQWVHGKILIIGDLADWPDDPHSSVR